MQNALYGGVNVAVLTAMKADLSIDLDLMATHARWLLAQGGGEHEDRDDGSNDQRAKHTENIGEAHVGGIYYGIAKEARLPSRRLLSRDAVQSARPREVRPASPAAALDPAAPVEVVANT